MKKNIAQQIRAATDAMAKSEKLMPPTGGDKRRQVEMIETGARAKGMAKMRNKKSCQ